MFFVFGPAGQIFRGSAEQLAQVTPVTRIRRSAALIAQDATHSSTIGTAADSHASPSSGAPHALTAYRQAAHSHTPARQPLSHVVDVMSTQVVAVTDDTMQAQAWNLLVQKGVSQAPVLNAQGRVVGLLLRADMAPLVQRPVTKIMLSPIPTVAHSTELRRLARVLLDTGLPGLPVTDDEGTLTGFVSRTDILRAVAAHPPLDLWSGS